MVSLPSFVTDSGLFDCFDSFAVQMAIAYKCGSSFRSFLSSLLVTFCPLDILVAITKASFKSFAAFS